MATKSSTTGINTEGIGKIKSAIDAYRKAVSKKCDVSAKASLITSAVKGTTSEQTLKQMALAIDTKMKEYIRQLDQYDQLLDSMKTLYTANDESNTSFSEVTKNLNV
jgi:hypothetical protein